jgi:integrase
MCLGLREGDAIRAPVTFDQAMGTLTIITAKTRRRVSVVVPADVRAAIAARTRCDATTLCVSSRHAPWTEIGFRASFFGLIRRLEAEGTVGAGLTFHGLRHTVGTTLHELGYDTRTIADVLGQSTVQMAEHSSSEADLTEKIGAAVHHLDRARKGHKTSAARNERRHRVSNFRMGIV